MTEETRLTRIRQRVNDVHQGMNALLIEIRDYCLEVQAREPGIDLDKEFFSGSIDSPFVPKSFKQLEEMVARLN